MTEKYWMGELDVCQFCKGNYNGTMYDARLRYGAKNVWANVCEPCFKGNEGQLGTGRGQKYQQQADGRWLKTAG